MSKKKGLEVLEGRRVTGEVRTGEARVIARASARVLGVTWAQFTGRFRPRRVCLARSLAAYLARERGIRWRDIAAAFAGEGEGGGGSHTTWHGARERFVELLGRDWTLEPLYAGTAAALLKETGAVALLQGWAPEEAPAARVEPAPVVPVGAGERPMVDDGEGD